MLNRSVCTAFLSISLHHQYDKYIIIDESMLTVFSGSETTLYDTVTIGIYHYTPGQSQKMSNTKSEP